ncbi:hypothetical protein M3Y97_00428200 [Aphelenchoides bicaudatus]|nr:hypothetical protein M3Y97_00428200 [Aphelenchoides bicaudatus]
MIIEQDESLNEWIKKRIEEICDAEPVAFAKYVLALLKKDSSEEKLRDICEEQLNVFLGSNTKEFVDSLFDAINNRSYIKGSTSPGTSNEKSSSHDAVEKRDSGSSDVQGKSDSGRNQRRRISPPRAPVKDEGRQRDVRRRRSRSRSPVQRRRYNARDRYRSRSRSRSRSPRRDYHRRERSDRNVVSSDVSSSRPRCRDYEEKGICRQENCKFDHGDNAIVMNSYQSKFTNPPPPGVDVSQNGSGPEQYNPEAPGIGAPVSTNMPNFNFSVPPPPLPGNIIMGQMNGMMPMNPYMQAQNIPPMQQGFGRGFGRGRGRGGRFGHYSERVQPNKSTTIEIRHVPPEVNKLGIIHNHFEQFGDITNIQISFDGCPDTALITYAKMPDAQKAMKSEKPILDNRFIKVSWHKPPPPKPEVTAETKAEQDPSLSNVKPVIPLMSEPKASSDHIPTNQLNQAQAARRVQQLAEEKLQARRKSRQQHAHLQKIHMLKSQLYEKQVKELKGIFERIGKEANPKVKSQLALLAKKVDESLKSLAKEIHELYEQIQKSEKKNDADGKAAKKRRLNSTNSEASEPDAKKPTDELNSSVQSEPADEATIHQLLAEQDSSENEEEGSDNEDVKKEIDDLDEEEKLLAG